jgi:hypothetical protein
MLNNNMDLSNGKIVWICAYDEGMFCTIPYLKIEPIKCITISNNLLPIHKKLYIHNFHFLSVDDENKLPENILQDCNLDFLIYNDTRINIFNNKKDCIKKWNELINYHIEKLDSYIKGRVKVLKNNIIK